MYNVLLKRQNILFISILIICTQLNISRKLWCLTPLSKTSQLYHVGQFHRCSQCQNILIYMFALSEYTYLYVHNIRMSKFLCSHYPNVHMFIYPLYSSYIIFFRNCSSRKNRSNKTTWVLWPSIFPVINSLQYHWRDWNSYISARI